MLLFFILLLLKHFLILLLITLGVIILVKYVLIILIFTALDLWLLDTVLIDRARIFGNNMMLYNFFFILRGRHMMPIHASPLNFKVTVFIAEGGLDAVRESLLALVIGDVVLLGRDAVGLLRHIVLQYVIRALLVIRALAIITYARGRTSE